MIIATDFDGTIVEHKYPKIGKEIPFAVDALKMLIKENHRIILWTVREGKLLEEAVEWCRQRGVEFYAINKDFPEEDINLLGQDGFSRKIKADIYIDDRNLGGIPDWGVIYRMIHSKNPCKNITIDDYSMDDSLLFKRKKQGFFTKLFK